MNEAAVRRRMADEGYSAEEIDATLSDMADAERDRLRDEQLEGELK